MRGMAPVAARNAGRAHYAGGFRRALFVVSRRSAEYSSTLTLGRTRAMVHT